MMGDGNLDGMRVLEGCGAVGILPEGALGSFSFFEVVFS